MKRDHDRLPIARTERVHVIPVGDLEEELCLCYLGLP
ncbi:MAG: hypothetical protein RBG13Loki_4286 [Promethearchaeota archaeon CR_4]|nr:MAG: hypothetical protein RBG13Loki_4286 [Candidatus Lokiarchaeota archaeon CR_4]